MNRKHTIWLVIALLFSAVTKIYAQPGKAEADSLYELGMHHFNMSNDEASIKYLRKSAILYLSLGDSSTWFKTTMALVESLSHTKESHEAPELMQKMEPFIRSKHQKTRFLMASGYLKYRSNHYKQSEKYYLEALEIAQDLSDSLNIAVISYYLSLNYYFIQDYYQADQLSDLALKYFKTNNLHFRQAQQLITKYHLHSALGNQEEALNQLRIAFKISVDSHLTTTNSVVSKYLGYYHLTTAAYDSAIYYFQRSINKRAEANSTYIDETLYYNLASLYVDIGNFEQAKPIFKTLIKLRVDKQNYWDAALLTNKLAAHFRSQNYPDSAKKYYSIADELFQRSGKDINDVSLIERGRSELLWGNPEKARELAGAVIQRNQDKDLSLIRSYAYQLLSQTEYYLGNYDNALILAKKAKYNPRGYLNDKEIDLEMDLNLARALHKSRNDSAIHYAEDALKPFIRLEFEVNDVFTRKIAGNYQFHLNEIASWYADLRYNPEIAHELTQIVKNQSLAKFFTDTKQSKNDLDKLKSDLKVNELTKLYHRFSNQVNRSDSSSLMILNKELSFDANQSRINLNSGTYHAIEHVLSLSEIQWFLDEETAVLDLAFFEYGLIVFLITEKGIKHQIFDAKATDELMHKFDDQNKIFMQVMKDKAEINELRSVSGFYEHYLFKPFYEELKSVKNLIVVPDGPVSQISLDPLLFEGKYLVERFNITYLPSVSTIPKLAIYSENQKSKFFAYAANDFSYEENAPAEIRKQSFLPLPFAGIEVNKISEYFSDTDVLTNDIYVEDYIKRTNLSGYDFIHFATHGVNNSSSQKFNKLILTNKLFNMNLTNDGHLTSYEVQDLDLNAELVVLSTCSMGSGTYVRGNGVMSMQKSFLIAGAKSVIVSQWEVVDQSTATFMDMFYGNLSELRDKSWLERRMFNQRNETSFGINYRAQALRDTKLQMIEHPYYHHPMHWASFSYTGF
jgi:CHAT domain-containing protein/tetratricopeptide (TPR) repeat protein